MTTLPLVLATDLDGTFAGGTPADRAALQGFVRSIPQSVLIYVTGRSVAATVELMAEAMLPQPDVLISDVGTSVATGPAFTALAAVEDTLAPHWPGADAIRDRLAPLPQIAEQDIAAPRRSSWWLRDGTMEDALRAMAERLAGLPIELVGSAGCYLDVLPRDVNKGATLKRVIAWLRRPADQVVVAGDSLNDLKLFESGYKGIMVGNAEPELRARAAHLSPPPFSARGEGAAGILEGLRHFGWRPAEVMHGQ